MADTSIVLKLLLVASVGLLYGAARLLRRVTHARDARLADELVAANKARWCINIGKPDGKPMDQPDWRLIDRAGERRWQETLEAQRRLRKPSEAAAVVVFRERSR